ncbi:MAG: phosphogluconate dehydrogenase C-terminal domain-containing protein [Roseiflexaceae bacterium]|nr:phosphogluconate dehydrogenase C-terminal domain-containing protein [Roseiflexaceae bacterium]
MTIRLALMGAGGKMGCRIGDNLKDNTGYLVDYIEISESGLARLAARGLQATPQDEALRRADAVILAVPDNLIGHITQMIVPDLKPGTMVIGLDPAASYAGAVTIRQDLIYFVAHPCHPPMFHDEVTEAARTDWFGGVDAKHHIVCALHHGPEEAYSRGEQISRAMYAPVMKAFRITVEQMAILEPALAETFTATVITAIKEAYDEAVKLGVPAEVAWEFLSGHARIEFAIIFGLTGFPFSDGAQLAIAQAYNKIFKPDWKEQIMTIAAIQQSVRAITAQD